MRLDMLRGVGGTYLSQTHCEYQSDAREDNLFLKQMLRTHDDMNHDKHVARCAKAIHLALPLGQHPCMDAARQVVLSILEQHAQNWF